MRRVRLRGKRALKNSPSAGAGVSDSSTMSEDYTSRKTILHQFNHFGNGHVRSSCRTLQRNSTISALCKENSKEMGLRSQRPIPEVQTVVLRVCQCQDEAHL